MYWKLFQQTRIKLVISDSFSEAAKLLRQNIFSAVDEFVNSFTQDGEEWQMLCMMSKMERRLVKHKCKEFREKRILSDEEAFSVTIKRQSLELLSHRSSSNSHDDAWGDKEKKMNSMQLV